MKEQRADGESPRSVRQWLADRQRSAAEGTRLGKATTRVLDVIVRDAAFASYATIGEFAARADAHASSVTRLSQSLGYSGWPALRAELRAVYLDSLEQVDHPAQREDADDAAMIIARDVDNVAALREPSTLSSIRAVAEAIAAAPRTVIAGSGLAAAPASVLGHLSLIAGRDLRTALGSATSQVSEVLRLARGDVLLLINVWRTTGLQYQLAELARERGITVCLMTDLAGSRLERFADHVIVASTESGGRVPSVTAMTSAAAAILAAGDLDDHAPHVRQVERAWNALGLMDAHD